MGYDMYASDDTEEYFRLNIWGMQTARTVMEKYEMGYWPASLLPCPEITDFFPTEEAYFAELDQIGDWSPERIAFFEANQDWLSGGLEERPGIAFHKLCSNDGWLVTAIECAGAVHQWHVNGRGLPVITDEQIELVWWKEWIDYLDRCGKSNGFVVY